MALCGTEMIWNEWDRNDGHVVMELTVTLEMEQHGGSLTNLPTWAYLKLSAKYPERIYSDLGYRSNFAGDYLYLV